MSNEIAEAKTIQDCLTAYNNYPNNELVNGNYTDDKITFINDAQAKVLQLLPTQNIIGIAFYLELEAHSLFSTAHQLKGVPANHLMSLLNIIAKKINLISLWQERDKPVVQNYINENNIFFPAQMSQYIQNQAALHIELREETTQQREIANTPQSTNRYSFVTPISPQANNNASIIELTNFKLTK